MTSSGTPDAQQPTRPHEPPGWHYITSTSADMRLQSVSPDGTSFLMTSIVMGDRGRDLLVTLGDPTTITQPHFERVTVDTPAHLLVDIIDRPWGPFAQAAGSDRGNEGGAVSPDLRYVAVQSTGGIWLGDLKTGAARRITSEPPEQWPADMGYRNPLIWAAGPRWSADSKWIYFQSNRRKPYTMAWWRIAVDGGMEEPVAHAVLIDQDDVAYEQSTATSPLQRIQAEGFFFRSLSPDRKWAAADQTDGPTFRLYNWERPEASFTYSYYPDHYAGVGYGSWSPDSSKILFHTRPMDGLEIFMGVLDLKSGGKTSLYAFPDPLAGVATAAGFVGSDQLLVSLQPWNADFTDRGSAATKWWLLDLKAVPPLQPQEPGRLVSARLAGGAVWKQAGDVTGGDVTAKVAASLALRFDRPVSPEWLQHNVLIDGSGTELETYEALLGRATVRIHARKPGDSVRIRVPMFGFDLLVRRDGT